MSPVEIDPRADAALRRQLAGRPAVARRVGWKVGRGDRERIPGEIVVGHLTSATLLRPGASYRGVGDLRADVEIALELGSLRPGDDVVAEIDGIGSVGVSIA
jgi:hypothetical protein